MAVGALRRGERAHSTLEGLSRLWCAVQTVGFCVAIRSIIRFLMLVSSVWVDFFVGRCAPAGAGQAPLFIFHEQNRFTGSEERDILGGLFGGL